MFLNGFQKIYEMFKEESFAERMGIINGSRFLSELIRLYIACTDNTTQAGKNTIWIYLTAKMSI